MTYLFLLLLWLLGLTCEGQSGPTVTIYHEGAYVATYASALPCTIVQGRPWLGKLPPPVSDISVTPPPPVPWVGCKDGSAGHGGCPLPPD